MFKCAVVFLISVGAVYARPQQDNNNLADVIANVFDTPSTPRRSGGFGEIVTPEPIVEPTREPQILSTNTGASCICVPYFLCSPENNTISTDGKYDGFGIIDIRFDPRTCQDVLDVCCTEERRKEMPIEVTPVDEKPNRPKGCGIRNVNGVDFQITGNFNNEANFGELPWTVAVISTLNESCICAGSLIHPQVILTGGHCVNEATPNSIKIRAGEWDTQTTKERLPHQERVASQIITHPQFNNRTLAYNTALVVLQQPFELADHINTICLPEQGTVSNSRECYASGWGKDVFGQAGKYSVIMKRVKLPIVDNGRCQNILRETRLGKRFVLSPTFICAGGEEGVDTCQGDGGAPLVCPVGPPADNRYVQSGIVSWGIGCNENRPAVYASVAFARNWIDEHMNKLGFGTASYTY